MDPLRPHPQPVGGAMTGMVYLVGILLALDGVLRIVRGVAALDDGTPGGRRPAGFLTEHPTAWGWIHLAVGAALLAVAIGVLLGSTRALVYAAVVAVVSALIGFVSIPYYPAWGVIGLVLNTAALFVLGTVGTTGPWAPSPADAVAARPRPPG
ncbi:MAG: hypothetical protein ABWX74_10445 [Aeromicrobium sp.]